MLVLGVVHAYTSPLLSLTPPLSEGTYYLQLTLPTTTNLDLFKMILVGFYVGVKGNDIIV